MKLRLVIAVLAALWTGVAFGQGVPLQGGQGAPGHVPQYVFTGTSQPVLVDGGGAGGGATGANVSELGIAARGTGNPPFVAQGGGPNGENVCDYDGPTTSAAGYHVLCLSANAAGGGLISYNAFGGAASLPLLFQINGALSGIVLGPGSTTNGDFACWNGSDGSLLSDCGSVIPIGKGGTGQITANAGLNALLPSQTGNSGKVLQTDGTNTSWQSSSSVGTVTTVSVASTNGFAGTVANPTTTPAITLSTTATGILQGNGTAISAASTTGSGAVVLASGPSVANLTVTGSFVAAGLVSNSDLANAATTVNGQTCTLGSTCTVTAAASGITIGTTTITGGANGSIEFNNAGILGEKTTTGSGSVVALATSPTFGTSIIVSGLSTGTATIVPQSAAGTPTLTLPTGTGTFAVSASSPIVLSATTGAITCPTCATSSGGGAVTGTAPVAVSAAGVVSITGAAGQVLAGASPAFTATPTLGVAGSTLGTITLAGSTSGTTVIQPNVAASGTLTLPAATDTLVGKATTDTFTNKTYDTAGTGNSFKINGTAITAVNGTGAVSLTTNPVFITPTLGVATATSINKMAITAPATISTLAVADGKTLTSSNTLTLAGTDGTTETFPATSATIARTDAAQTFTGVQTFGTPVAVGSGGTGLASGTSGGVPYYSASSTLASSGVLAANAIVVGGGAGASPTSSACTIDATQNIKCASTSTFTPTIQLTQSTADSSDAFFTFRKDRAGAAVQNGDFVGEFLSKPFANGGYQNNASLIFKVTGAPSGSNVPSSVLINSIDSAGNAPTETWDQNGHLSFTPSAVPAIGSCGATPSAATGSDNAGQVTEGTTATGCTITFANAYAATPFCVVGLQTQVLAFAYSLSNTAITVTNTSTSNDKINWVCHGT